MSTENQNAAQPRSDQPYTISLNSPAANPALDFMKSKKGLIIAGLILLSLAAIFLIAQPNQPGTIKTQLNSSLPLPGSTSSADLPATDNGNANLDTSLLGLEYTTTTTNSNGSTMNSNVNTSSTATVSVTNANVNGGIVKELGMDKTAQSGPEMIVPVLLSILAGLIFLRRKPRTVQE